MQIFMTSSHDVNYGQVLSSVTDITSQKNKVSFKVCYSISSLLAEKYAGCRLEKQQLFAVQRSQ